MLYSVEKLQIIANERHELHKNHESSRPLSKDYEYIGLAGEAAFAEMFSFPMDLETKPSGDGRVDFHTPIGTIDIKTARKAYNLLREAGKPHAEILILASYDDRTKKAVLLGWEYDSEMLKQPTKDFGYGIVNHYKAAKNLRLMDELRVIMNKALLDF